MLRRRLALASCRASSPATRWICRSGEARMSFRPNSKPLTIAVLLGTALAGCSDIYYDRRETISAVSGEANAANRVTHMIDPWPAASGRREIAYSGERMQTAHERYRTGCVTK